MITQEVLNWGLGVLTAASGGYGIYMNRKSRSYKKNEEDSIFVDNAEKLIGVWEKLSNGFQSELEHLRKESKEMQSKYTELKIDFEVSKSKSEFVIQQMKLEDERKSTIIDKMSVEITKLKTENTELKDQIGTGRVRNMNI